MDNYDGDDGDGEDGDEDDAASSSTGIKMPEL